MKISALRLIPVLLVVLLSGTTACVSAHKLPVIDGKEVVALVNGEPITQEEYEREILSLHTKMAEEQSTTGHVKAEDQKQKSIDYAGLMKRMIDVRLMVQEANRIGLNELPEVRQGVEQYSQNALRTYLMKQVLKDVQPDQAVVDEIYKRSIQEWKFRSIMFPKEDDAKQMASAIKADGDFAGLAGKAVADKKARVSIDEGYLNGGQILPQIYEALRTMGTGSVSPVIPVAGGYALVKIEDSRIEESQEKKDAALQEALQQKKKDVTRTFIESITVKLATTDKALLDGLDFESSVEAFEKMKTDDRALSEISGDGKITIADLAGEMQRRYFHGVERQLGRKGLNAKKYEVIDQMVEKKVLIQEARNRGIDKTEEYKVLVKVYENSLVFGTFVQRVVLPEVKIDETEIKAYYDGHQSEFTAPARMQLDSVVFQKRSDAEETMKKLRSGDQLSWIKENADGQVSKDAEGLMELNGVIVAMPTLSEGLRSALAGANAGDFRLYEGPNGYFYAIAVTAVYPSTVQEYEAVKQLIARQLFKERLQAGIATWVEKLRSAAEIKVFLN